MFDAAKILQINELQKYVGIKTYIFYKNSGDNIGVNNKKQGG